MLKTPVYCSDPQKMVGIALDEVVFNSGFFLYYSVTQQILYLFVFFNPHLLHMTNENKLYCV